MTQERAAHTAGPRRAVKGPDPKYAGQAPENVGFVLGGDDGKTVIGRFPSYGDAVLDAAAPDLLAELKEAEAYINRDQMGEEGPLLKSIRAAIAKATGAL